MKRIILYLTLIILQFFSFKSNGQFLPNFYPVLESNKGVSNKQVNYNLFSLTSSNSFPTDSASFNTYVKAGTLQKYGSTNLAVEKGTINTSVSTQYNPINWNNYTQLQNAIFGGSSPYSGFGDYFAFVVSGYFIPKETGTYTFSIEADDADELVVNNKVVVSQYNGHGASSIGTHTGTISLIAGIKYQFRARMQEYAGGEALNVFWKKPSEISSSSWYQDVEELSSLNVIINGLVYKFDFNNQSSYPLSGTKVYDQVNGLVGNVSGATYKDTVKTLPNNSFYFNGTTNSIDLGKNPANFPNGDISVSVWVNFQDLVNAWNIFLTKWFNGIVDGEHDFHYAVKYNSVNSNYYQNLYTTNNNDMFGTTIITKYNWYCLGFTLTNGGTLQFYINGLPDGPPITGVTRTNNSTSNLYLGDPRNPQAGFIGYMSAVNIYDRALSSAEMLSNFNSEKSRFGLMFSPVDPSYWYTSTTYSGCCNTPWIDSQQGWAPSSAGLSDYIYIKLDKSRYVNGIVTQGRADYAQWVTKGTVEYKNEGDASWTSLGTFNLNVDQNTKVYNYFTSPVFAKYIKVTPTAYGGAGGDFPTMRFGVMY